MVCQKPNSDTELVIRYDCEDKLHPFNFSDCGNSVVKLTSITPTNLLGKRTRQRFTSIEENDLWWEQEICNFTHPTPSQPLPSPTVSYTRVYVVSWKNYLMDFLFAVSITNVVNILLTREFANS